MDQQLNHLIKDTIEGLKLFVFCRTVAQGQSEEVEKSQALTLIAKRLWKLFQRHSSFCWQE